MEQLFDILYLRDQTNQQECGLTMEETEKFILNEKLKEVAHMPRRENEAQISIR